MIQTSYFAKAASLSNAAAISQRIPTWYHGARYKPLAPSWEMIHIKDPELYRKRYCQEVLSKLDPRQVAAEDSGYCSHIGLWMNHIAKQALFW
jgi:hypothetical protein